MSAVCPDRRREIEVILQGMSYTWLGILHDSLSPTGSLNLCPEKLGIGTRAIQWTVNVFRDLRNEADGKAAPTAAPSAANPKPERAKPAPASPDVIAFHLEKEMRKRAKKAGLDPRRQRIAGFWKNKAVRNFVISLKGEMSLGKAAIAVRARFGERAPTKSTIQRLWQKMEAVAWVR
jgi:pyruvate/2-oxoglutarate dehydrogenase complex dihydrolipoamide acyltransferase (E2) component